MSALEIALSYVARGWNPIPIAHRAKKPIGEGWQHRRIDANSAPQYFNGAEQNVGVQLGRASGGLVDIDLDCPESLYLANSFLPATDAIFGRASKPRSHRLYRSNICETLDDAAVQFKDPEAKTGAMLVELRIGGGISGAQTVFPGSTHESGEAIEWEVNGEPAPINGEHLSRQVQRLAAGCLIARHWPAEGGRHDLGLTLGGFLSRAGWSEPEVTHFVEAVAKCIRDPQWQDRITASRDNWWKHKADAQGRGLPALIAAIGEKPAKKVAEWLNYAEPVFAETPVDPWERFIVPPFPMDTFNKPIRDFIETKSRVIGVDPAALAMTALANFSGAQS